MQKSITSFFNKSPTGITKKATKRSATAKTPTSPTKSPTPADKQAPKEATLSPEVRAKIEANRARARANRLKRLTNLTTAAGLTDSLEPSWRAALSHTLGEPFWHTLVTFVAAERAAATVYPAPDCVFSAFNHSTFARTRVVIIGQDPYHGPRQAHGMSFSVPDGVYPPPSLQNIFRELEADVPGFRPPAGGNLHKWANQGVLLLNAVLTVRRAQPASHQNRGWERFTDAVVAALNARNGPGCVFLLWGRYAQRKGAAINRNNHCVLTSVHPSPLSANRGGWFGNRHFSAANEFLTKTGQDVIDWKL